jgi:hypothetical protein
MKDESFDVFRDKLLSIDPVFWCEKYLTLDGKPFRLHGNGYKPFSDIYRYIGIKALEPNSLPVMLVKGRQVGGTTLASALEMYFVGCGLFGTNGKPPVRIIHAFPQQDIAKKFSKEKLNPMILSSLPVGESIKGQAVKSYMQLLLDRSTDTGDSLEFKSFKDGNFIRIDSTGLDGGRLRGGTADVIFYDEVQDISAEAIGNTVEMLKQAKHGRIPGGVQVYFGTPKRKGSNFYKMWNVSSQQYYYLGCEHCHKHFPLYTPGSDEWEKIWIHGFIVKCTHCGHEQDKRLAAERGKWVATKDVSDGEVKYIGFHINQFYMPNIKREDIQAERPGIHPTNTERKFQNEVLGEFFQGDASPITSEEIITECGERDRGVRARIKPGEEQMVVLGIDYGARSDLESLADPDRAKAGQSYTTAVVMSVKGPNLFSVDLAIKFPKNDPEAKKGLIDTIMRQYSVDIAVGDIGYSNDFSHTLHTVYGDRYLVSRAHNRINDKVKFNADAYPKEIIFERDYFISEMFELLKKGQIKFPLKDYDRIAWLIEHCTSMELRPSISRNGGDPEIHYVKGSTPNDGAMALLNAILAYKYYVTGGFKIKNPTLMNKAVSGKGKALALTGFIKRKM